MIFWKIIPVLYNQEKRNKIQKFDFLGLCSRLNCVKKNPKFMKKNTVGHSIPGGLSGKKKFDASWLLYAGSSANKIKIVIWI